MGERMGWPIASSCTPIAISKCIPRESRLRNRIPHRMFERLERYAGKLARAVLRGRDGGNTILLPGGDGGNAVSLLDHKHLSKIKLVLFPCCFISSIAH